MKPKMYNFQTHKEGKRVYGSVKKYRQAMREIEEMLYEASRLRDLIGFSNRDRSRPK